MARRASLIKGGRSLGRKLGSARARIVIICPRKLHCAGNNYEQKNLSQAGRLPYASTNTEFHVDHAPFIKFRRPPPSIFKVPRASNSRPKNKIGPERQMSHWAKLPACFRRS